MSPTTSAVSLSLTQQAQVKYHGDAQQYALMYRYIADEIKAGP